MSFFPVVSSERINLVLVIPSWLEAEILVSNLKKITFTTSESDMKAVHFMSYHLVNTRVEQKYGKSIS